MSLVEQWQSFFANHLPLLGDGAQFGELAHVDIGLGLDRREQVHQRVVRRQQIGVIGHQPGNFVTHSAAKLHVRDAGKKREEDEQPRR